MTIDVTIVVVTVYDLLQLCHITADTSDENTFLQMSEIKSGIVSEHGRHVSTLDDTLDILEGLRGLIIAIVT